MHIIYGRGDALTLAVLPLLTMECRKSFFCALCTMRSSTEPEDTSR